MRAWVGLIVASAACGDNLHPCDLPKILVDGKLVTIGDCGEPVPDGCDAPPQAVVTDRGLWLGQLAVDAAHVYFTDYEGGWSLIKRKPVAGGPAETIALKPDDLYFGFQMAVHDRHLFWSGRLDATRNGLFSTPGDAGETDLRVVMDDCPMYGVAVDDLNAYGGTLACNGTRSRVVARPHAGGPPWFVWEASHPADEINSIAVGGGDVLLSTTLGLYRASATGGPATRLIQGETYSAVLVNGVVYALMDDAVYEIRSDGSRAPVLTLPAAQDASLLRSLARDGTDLYVAWPPNLYHLDLQAPGGLPTLLVPDMGRYPGAMVAGNGRVYWAAVLPAVPAGLDYNIGAVLQVTAPCAP